MHLPRRGWAQRSSPSTATADDPKLLDQATEWSNRAIGLQPELAAPYITLARIAALERDTDQATVQVKKALSLEPNSAEAHGAQGEVYEAQGRDKEAIAEYQQAIDSGSR